MKNLVFAIFALVSFVIVSCDKDVETSPVSVDLSQKATVTGYVYADLNLTDAGKEPVANVEVIVSIPNSDLMSGASGNWIDTIVTDNTGKFVATVPTKNAGVNVTVTTTDFIRDQTQSLTSQYQTISKLFTGAAQTSFKILPGESKIKLFEYGDPIDLKDFDNLVTIKGKAYAETDLNNSVTENAPLVDIIFATTDGLWSKKVTLIKEGAYTTYTIDVPNNKTIRYTYDFTAEKNVPDGGTGWTKVLYRYKGTTTLSAYSVKTEGVNLDFGTGTKVE